MIGRYKVITLCGSTRFKDQFLEQQALLTLEGYIVLSACVFLNSDEHRTVTAAQKRMLDDMHKRKIDLADEILVINVGGYIGESTAAEIEYARRNGRTVKYLEKPNQIIK